MTTPVLPETHGLTTNPSPPLPRPADDASTGRVEKSSPLEFDVHAAAADREFRALAERGPGQGEFCNSLSSVRRLMAPICTACLIVLTIMAICYSLYFCKPVMLPIVGAFLLNFLFSPVVARMNRYRIPNAVAALLILTASLGALFLLVLFAYDPAKEWLTNRQENLVIVESKLMSLRKPLDQLRDVSKKIDKLTAPEAKDNEPLEIKDPFAGLNLFEPRPTAPQVPIPLSPDYAPAVVQTEPEDDKDSVVEPVPVEVRQPSISSRIFSTTGDVIIGFSLMTVLLFYLLASGDRGLEKLIGLMPNWRQKRRTVELARAIEKSVSVYLVTTTIINAGLGVIIGLGMWLIGMPNPILWGVMAMLLNFFPFVGAVIGGTVVFLVAVISFDSVAFAALAPAIYTGVNLIEANFITPILLGHSVSLHPVWLMIFFVIVSWVWGLGGAIVAVPVLAVIKISCDHIEPLVPLGTFLGR